MGRVLIVERCPTLASELVRAVRAADHVVHQASHDDAIDRAAREPFDLLVLDVSGPDDLATIRSLRAVDPRLGIVACGPGESQGLAVESVRCGARDFLRKPFPISELEQALSADSARSARRGVAAPLTQEPGMERCLRLAETAAGSGATVLIIGDSGTGKDHLARWIHRQSERRAQPYVVVNCAALPESVAESELFGHEQGAFTGAVAARLGQIAAADGGTLMLDEVSELAPSLQPKLLRVLQEREVQAVGALAPRPVDVRVIATSQHDLGEAVATGAFRADLFYRLDVVTVRLPALRERRGDVPLLAEAFLARFAAESGAPPPRLGEGALARLEQHPFRGNVRELENLMRRAVVLHAGREIDAERLLAPPGAASRRGTGGGAGDGEDSVNLRELERRAIERALASCAGNRTIASRHLGISVRTLRNKIRLYGLA